MANKKEAEGSTPPVIEPEVKAEPEVKTEPEIQTPQVVQPDPPAGKISFTLKDTYRWNDIQSAGLQFSKGAWRELPEDDPRVAELKANPWLGSK